MLRAPESKVQQPEWQRKRLERDDPPVLLPGILYASGKALEILDQSGLARTICVDCKLSANEHGRDQG